MKNLLVFIGMAVFSSSAFGSHYISCNASVTVLSVDNIGTLNESTIFSNPSFDFGAESTYSQTITIGEFAAEEIVGSESCDFLNGSKTTLLLSSDEVDTFEVGQLLRVSYENVGDVTASKVSFKVLN